MRDLEPLNRLAATQHGLVSRRQVAAEGLTSAALLWAVESRRVEWLSRRVLRFVGSPATDLQRAMAATLDTDGGAVARRSALALFGIPGCELAPIHVLTSRRPHRGSAHLGVVHSSRSFTPDHVVLVHGVPVTSPARALRDVAGSLGQLRLEYLCDDLLRREVLTLPQLHEMVESLPRRGGSRGAGHLRRLVLERPIGWTPTESRLERRFERLLEGAGEPPFLRQVDLGDDESWIGRVDFADRHHELVVEVQSERFHSTLSDRRRDQERRRRLEAAGWTVIEVTEDEIWHHPGRVVERVRRARRRAGRPAA